LSRIKYITYGYLLILLIGTLVPFSHGSTVLSDNYTLHIRWDYLIHAFAYLPMPVLLGLVFLIRAKDKALQQSKSFSFWIGILLIALLIAACFEALQLIIPYRSFNINDMLANCIGVLLGLFLVPILRKFHSRYAIESVD